MLRVSYLEKGHYVLDHLFKIRFPSCNFDWNIFSEWGSYSRKILRASCGYFMRIGVPYCFVGEPSLRRKAQYV
jgi:hypothetical protein